MEDAGTMPPQKKAEVQVSPTLYNASIERIETKGIIYLIFIFFKIKLNNEIIKKHFNTPFFTIEDALLLPITITNAFDLPPSVLEVGLYEIVEKNNCFQIQIQITQILDL